jgi:hypothetical protein
VLKAKRFRQREQGRLRAIAVRGSTTAAPHMGFCIPVKAIGQTHIKPRSGKNILPLS